MCYGDDGWLTFVDSIVCVYLGFWAKVNGVAFMPMKKLTGHVHTITSTMVLTKGAGDRLDVV